MSSENVNRYDIYFKSLQDKEMNVIFDRLKNFKIGGFYF